MKTSLMLGAFIMISTFSAFAFSAPITLGRFSSRAIWTKSANTSTQKKAPAVILLPGSGEFGPEEVMPKFYPLSGNDGYPLLNLYAQSFQIAGFHTLQLGKPGVEFFESWEKVVQYENFYDKTLWAHLRWADLITNVEDAIEFLKNDPNVDADRIYLLGHSEGTVVASDVAVKHPEIAGVILLGYAGESILSTLEWQTFDRQLEQVIASDIDSNHDGFISESEARLWPADALFPPSYLSGEKNWDWKARPLMSMKEISDLWRSDPILKKQADISTWLERFPFWADFAKRTDIKETTASINGSVHVFTGEFDVNTPPAWSFRLKNVCERIGKNCVVTIVPRLTHKFAPVNSTFAGPHFNSTLDQGLNPVDPNFLSLLTEFAKTL